MPRKRIPAMRRETPEARALRAAVLEELGAMISRLPDDGLTEEQRERRDAKDRRRMDRVMAKARAKWDAASPAWRERQGAKILAFSRRYDRSATLPADGGRELYAVDRYAAKNIREAAKAPAADHYAAHRASIPAAGAVRPAPAPKAEPVTDELAEKRKAARRRPPGLAGYVRITDDDDFEDWE